MTALAFGHVLRIKPYSTVDFRFQNFFLGEQMEYDGASYQFVPFGFSGVTVNRTGDGLEATLVFPNNDATRAQTPSSVPACLHCNACRLSQAPSARVASPRHCGREGDEACVEGPITKLRFQWDAPFERYARNGPHGRRCGV